MSNYVTQKDFFEALQKMSEENKEDRHSIRNQMQTALSISEGNMHESVELVKNQITTLEPKIELMKQSHERMQLDLTDLKKDVKEGFKQLGDKIEKQDERNDVKFATKDDHKRNSDRIDIIAKVLIGIATLIGTAVLGAILKLVIIG